MKRFSASPVEMFASLWRNRALIQSSARREVLGRYRGSMLGILWSFFNPLFMLAVYTFVFSEVFKARWSVDSSSKTEFALILFSGLIMFNMFSDCINRSTTLMQSYPNYVKKVVFPLEILPVVIFLASLYHLLISLSVWLLVYVVFYGAPHPTVILLPLILIPFAFMTIGLSWVLASLGVFLRDVGQFIGMLTMALLFVSPIFYPVSALPEAYRQILYLNPLTTIIEQTRGVLFWGEMPNLMLLGLWWVVALVIAWLGFAWFQKTRKGFADVL